MADRTISAEIGGVVFAINVSAGQQVGADEALAVLESMKMHIPVEAPEGGVITEVLVFEGATVTEGQAMFRMTS